MTEGVGAGSAGEIAQAFVRIRPDTSGFRGELQSSLKQSLSSLRGTKGTLQIAGLDASKAQLAGLGATAEASAAQQVVASKVVRSAREQEARDSVASSLTSRRALQEQFEAYRLLAAGAVAGSRAQIEANRLAAATAAQAGLTTRESALAQVQAAAQVRAEELALAKAYLDVGNAAKLGSVEQAEAFRLAESSAAATGLTFRRTASGAGVLRHELGSGERGAIAASGAFRGMGRSIAFASGSFLGAYGLIGVIRSSINSATSLNREIALGPTVFGRSAAAVDAWSAKAYHGLGLAGTTALQAADSFGILLKGMGVAPARAALLSESLTKVAAALSLAKGEQSPAAAEDAILTALSGRGLALKRYGVVVDQTTLKAEALRLGLVRTSVDSAKVELAYRKQAEALAVLSGTETKYGANSVQVARAQDAVTTAHLALQKALDGTTVKLTKEQTAEAASAIILQKSAPYVHEYRKALESAAGKQRLFHQGMQELRAELGTATLPAFDHLIGSVDKYIAEISVGGSKHKQFERDLHDVGTAAKYAYEGLSLAATGVRDVSSVVGGLGNALAITGGLFAADKALNWYYKIKESRLAVLLLGDAFKGAGAGATTLGADVAGLETTLGAATLKTGLLVRALTGLRALGAKAFVFSILFEWANKLEQPTFPGAKPPSDLLKGSTALAEGWYQFGSHFVHWNPKTGKFDQDTTTRPDLHSPGITPGANDPTARARQISGLIQDATKRATPATTKAGMTLGQAFTDSVGAGAKSRMEQLQSELASVNQQLAQAVSAGAAAMQQALATAAKDEHDAVVSAKANLNTLGGTLSSQIGQFLDAQSQANLTKPRGPLARQLAELEKLIHQGRATPELIRQAQKVESELNAQSAANQQTVDQKKLSITRRLADLTDEFNQGRISIRTFNRDVAKLLASEGLTYKSAGKSLGVAFADGFRESIQEIRAQAAAIAATPAGLRRSATGLETTIVRPLDTLKTENQNIANVASQERRTIADLIRRRHELLLKEQQAAHVVARAQGKTIIAALQRPGPHPAAVTAARAARTASPRPTLDESLLAEIRQTTAAVREVARVDADWGGQIVKAERVLLDQERRTDVTASEQRSVLIRENRTQTRELQRQTELLRDVRRELKPRRPLPGKPVGTKVADEARTIATHNLSA